MSKKPTRVLVTLVVDVNDPAKLIEYTKKVYERAWGTRAIPADIPRQVLEAVVLSNENPSPDEYGIEFIHYNAEELPT